MATSKDLKKLNLEEAALESEARIRSLENEKKMVQTSKDLLAINKQISKETLYQQKLIQQLQKLEEDLEDILESQIDSLNKQIRSLDVKKRINEKLLDNEERQLDLATIYQEKLKQHPEDANRLLKEYKAQSEILEDNLQIEKAMLNVQNAELKVIKAIREAQKKNAEEYVKGIESNMRKIPVLGDLMANTLMGKKAQKALTKQFTKFFKSNPGLKRSLVKAGPGLGLMGLGIGLTGAGLKATFQREQEMKDQQRAIGLTNDQSKAVDKIQRRLLFSSKSMVTSMEEARKASAELVDDFGTYGAENETLVDQQVKLTKAYGLQAEDASNFQRTAKIAGKDTEVVKREVFAVAAGFNKATGSTQSLSAVLRTVSKTSDAIRIQFRGSDKELTNAVMKSKMLGTSLEDLNGIADNLLNIESSIENQVTAQLVTGRNINMDKARMFALQDDMNGLMDELVKQEIDYNAYSKMNRVEKQSTAAALGMNTDQMAKFVSQQELARKLGIDMSKAENQTAEGLQYSLKGHQERIAQMAKEGDLAAQRYETDNETLTTQEKMTAAVEQMALTFKYLGPILAALGVVITIIGAALAFAAISAAAIAISSTLGSAAIPILVGVGLVAAGIYGHQKHQKVQDGIAPASNGPFTITDRKGNIGVTTAGDGLIATPNKPNKPNNASNTNTTNSQPMVNVSLVVGNTAIKEIGNKIAINNNYNAGVGNSYNRLG